MGLEEIFTASVFAAAIRLATPYIFAALGETFAQRSGVLNLGVDGMMLMGAFTGFYAVYLAQQNEAMSEPMSLLLGVAVALIVGALMGLAMAVVSVTLKAKTRDKRHRRLSLRAGSQRVAIPAMGGHAEIDTWLPAHYLSHIV